MIWSKDWSSSLFPGNADLLIGIFLDRHLTVGRIVIRHRVSDDVDRRFMPDLDRAYKNFYKVQ
jgi:hypothetical protein